MKYIIITLALVGSNLASSEAAILAEMKYHSVAGTKTFSARWFEKKAIGFISLGLVWDEFDESVESGFILDRAEMKEFISPKMPAQCEIESVKGFLNAAEKGLSGVSITVVGEGCMSFIEALKTTPIEMSFRGVKHFNPAESTSKLYLRITELPE